MGRSFRHVDHGSFVNIQSIKRIQGTNYVFVGWQSFTIQSWHYILDFVVAKYGICNFI